MADTFMDWVTGQQTGLLRLPTMDPSGMGLLRLPTGDPYGAGLVHLPEAGAGLGLLRLPETGDGGLFRFNTDSQPTGLPGTLRLPTPQSRKAYEEQVVPPEQQQRNQAQRQQQGQFAGNQVAPTVAGATGRGTTGVPPQYQNSVAQAAQQYRLDPALIGAVMGQESGGDPNARSYKGASGLMQLMPSTAAGLGVTDINDPHQNIMAGARYLREQLDRFGGNTELALAAYNAGPGAVMQAGNRIPDGPGYDETRRYVPAVMQRYQALQGAGQAPQAVAAPANASGYAFPVQGYQGQVNLHHGSARGGSDIMAPEGTPVVAMRGGTVLSAGSSGPGGNNVLIQGDDGNQYYYAHFRDAPLVRGGRIETGTPLGFVGRTGNAAGTPPHLHLGIGPSIVNGVGPLGGTGGNFDAVALLTAALAAAAAGR